MRLVKKMLENLLSGIEQIEENTSEIEALRLELWEHRDLNAPDTHHCHHIFRRFYSIYAADDKIRCIACGFVPPLEKMESKEGIDNADKE